MARRWLRLDADWDSSEWVFECSPLAQLAWIKLLCYAKRSGVGGTVRALSLKVFAGQSGIPIEAVREMLDGAQADGALALDGREWVITAWAEYNPPDPTAAERKRRQRQKEQQDTAVPPSPDTSRNVTGCHGVTICDLSRDEDVDVDGDVSQQNSVSNETGAARQPKLSTSAENPVNRVMGRLRELGYAMDGQPGRTNGSIVKAMLGQGRSPAEIELAAEGFAQLCRLGRFEWPAGEGYSLRPIHATNRSGFAVGLWQQSIIAANEAAKRRPSGPGMAALGQVLQQAING